MSLSDKGAGYYDPQLGDVTTYLAEDVKRFIKELKEEVMKADLNILDIRDIDMDLPESIICKNIDKLAGSKLI